MVDKDLIKTKIALIHRDLERLMALRDLSIDEIVADFYKWSTLKLLLVEIIGRAIDINAHIISEAGDPNVSVPASSRETFVRLGEMGVLPMAFAAEIAKSVGFRNRVVHEYNDLIADKVYHSVSDALAQYTRYCGFILTYVGSKDS